MEDTYDNFRMAEKIIANSYYPYPVHIPDRNIFFWPDSFNPEEITRTGKQILRDLLTKYDIMIENNKVNKFERFKILRNEAQIINEQINDACEKLLGKNLDMADEQPFIYKGWDFNNRETLVEISYALGSDPENIQTITASFDELNEIIEENSPKIRNK